MITESQVRQINQAILKYDISKDVIKATLSIINNSRKTPDRIIPQDDKTIFLEWSKENVYTFMLGIYPDCFEYLEDIGGQTYRTVFGLDDQTLYEILNFIESKAV